MNFPFSTGAERIAVIEDLRKPGVYFPPSWPTHLERQKKSGPISLTCITCVDGRSNHAVIATRPIRPTYCSGTITKSATSSKDRRWVFQRSSQNDECVFQSIYLFFTSQLTFNISKTWFSSPTSCSDIFVQPTSQQSPRLPIRCRSRASWTCCA